MRFEDLMAAPAEPTAAYLAGPANHDREYAAIQALNWSTAKLIETSPRLLRWRAEHPAADTDALRVGRAIHCASLESERWRTAYVAKPHFGDMRTKIARRARMDWLATLPPAVEMLSAEEHALAERCAAAVREHPVARDLLRSGRAEEIITWTDEATGVDCKARLDFIAPLYVVDLKSSRHSSVRMIVRQFADLLYHGQIAMYHDGAIAAGLIPSDADGPYAIVVQTVEPYDVVALELSRAALETGRELYRSCLRKYVACQAADWWPGISPDLITLDLPPWAAGGDESEDW